MSRIAAPMVGGMISSTVLTLCVIPALYALIKQWQLQREAPTVTDAPSADAAPAAQPASRADAREGEQANPGTTP
jgi:Cu(I)/Ag(I) efflux system membrane protein CusA/SilA